MSQLKTEAAYQQRKVVYRNLGTGRFVDVTERLGPAGVDARRPAAARPSAISTTTATSTSSSTTCTTRPDVFRTESRTDHRWLTVQLVGTTSNRSAIGARVRVVAGELTLVDEVRGGGSYLSQNDLRVHFGLGGYDGAVRASRCGGRTDGGGWEHVASNQILVLKEGTGTRR